jgi:hypothetical protein
MQYDEQTQQQMLRMITSWKQSALSQKAFCEQNNIRYYVFHYWYKRYRDNQSAEAKEKTFIPLNVSPSSAFNQRTAEVEIVLPDGKRILFHQPVSSDYLKAIIG